MLSVGCSSLSLQYIVCLTLGKVLLSLASESLYNEVLIDEDIESCRTPKLIL